MNIEYRVRPVTRYVVTRWHRDDNGGSGVADRGEYLNYNMAYEVAYALCRAEHEVQGWPIGDTRIQYPKPVLSDVLDDLTATDVMIQAGIEKMNEVFRGLLASKSGVPDAAAMIVSEVYAAMRAARTSNGGPGPYRETVIVEGGGAGMPGSGGGGGGPNAPGSCGREGGVGGTTPYRGSAGQGETSVTYGSPFGGGAGGIGG